MTYQQVLRSITLIKNGSPQSTIETLLGQPDRQKGNYWMYNFTKLNDFPKLPPIADDHILLGATVFFDHKKVRKVKHCWFDQAA